MLTLVFFIVYKQVVPSKSTEHFHAKANRDTRRQKGDKNIKGDERLNL